MSISLLTQMSIYIRNGINKKTTNIAPVNSRSGLSCHKCMKKTWGFLSFLDFRIADKAFGSVVLMLNFQELLISRKFCAVKWHRTYKLDILFFGPIAQYGVLDSWTSPLLVEAWSLNHWTSREVPQVRFIREQEIRKFQWFI